MAFCSNWTGRTLKEMNMRSEIEWILQKENNFQSRFVYAFTLPPFHLNNEKISEEEEENKTSE